MNCGDEILRAVLDKSCAYSNPAFYTIEIVAPNPAPTTIIRQPFKAKMDRSFLITGITQYHNDGTNLTDSTVAVFLSLINPNSSYRYWSTQHNLFGMLGGSINQQYTMAEYIYMEEGDSIVLELLPDNVQALSTTGVMLNGIEYAR